MNFLAHAYLSFNHPEALIGNLIADVVRGKQIDVFPMLVQRGIEIHRHIDSFTDNHPINKETKLVFRDSAKRYDSSFLDVAYDYFLATDKESEPKGGWQSFADECYEIIEIHSEILPELFSSMYIYMRSENWLANYHNYWMIERSFERLKRRASYLDDNAPVFEAFEVNIDTLQKSYNSFFPELREYARNLVENIDSLDTFLEK